jgi:hypothetical protein
MSYAGNSGSSGDKLGVILQNLTIDNAAAVTWEEKRQTRPTTEPISIQRPVKALARARKQDRPEQLQPQLLHTDDGVLSYSIGEEQHLANNRDMALAKQVIPNTALCQALLRVPLPPEMLSFRPARPRILYEATHETQTRYSDTELVHIWMLTTVLARVVTWDMGDGQTLMVDRPDILAYFPAMLSVPHSCTPTVHLENIAHSKATGIYVRPLENITSAVLNHRGLSADFLTATTEGGNQLATPPGSLRGTWFRLQCGCSSCLSELQNQSQMEL